jgi:hypothetical protein
VTKGPTQSLQDKQPLRVESSSRTSASSCQALGSMSNGGLSDKKLIIYVSSSCSPHQGMVEPQPLSHWSGSSPLSHK